MRRRPAPTILLLALLSSCGDASADAAAASLDGPDRTLELATEPVFTVGALDGAEWETFSGVEAVAFDGAGNLHVFDPENHRVVVVGPDGGHVRTVGQEGEGPGELRSPRGMAVTPEGAVVIADVRAQAFHRFSPEGGFLEQVRYEGDHGFPVGAVRAAPSGGALLTSGRGIVMRFDFDSRAGEPEEPDHVPIRRISLADGSDTTLYRAWLPPEPGQEEEQSFQGAGGNRMVIRMDRLEAFRPRVHLGVLPDGGMVVADSTDWSLDVLAPDGTRRGLLRRPLEPAVATEEVREAERERRLAELDESGGIRLLGGGGMGTDLQERFREMRRQQIQDMAFADVVPVIADLAVDHEGRIWVERSGEMPGEPGPIDVVGAEGTYHGTVPPDPRGIPDAFGPDRLAAWIETDEYDVPRVRVERITTQIP